MIMFNVRKAKSVLPDVSDSDLLLDIINCYGQNVLKVDDLISLEYCVKDAINELLEHIPYVEFCVKRSTSGDLEVLLDAFVTLTNKGVGYSHSRGIEVKGDSTKDFRIVTMFKEIYACLEEEMGVTELTIRYKHLDGIMEFVVSNKTDSDEGFTLKASMCGLMSVGEFEDGELPKGSYDVVTTCKETKSYLGTYCKSLDILDDDITEEVVNLFGSSYISVPEIKELSSLLNDNGLPSVFSFDCLEIFLVKGYKYVPFLFKAVGDSSYQVDLDLSDVPFIKKFDKVMSYVKDNYSFEGKSIHIARLCIYPNKCTVKLFFEDES